MQQLVAKCLRLQKKFKYGLFLFVRPDGMGTITEEEQEEFEEIRVRLLTLLENQITHFR